MTTLMISWPIRADCRLQREDMPVLIRITAIGDQLSTNCSYSAELHIFEHRWSSASNFFGPLFSSSAYPFRRLDMHSNVFCPISIFFGLLRYPGHTEKVEQFDSRIHTACSIHIFGPCCGPPCNFLYCDSGTVVFR